MRRYISISDEKPGPWRRLHKIRSHSHHQGFQSQTRSQAPGDMSTTLPWPLASRISISDEKPGPWRPRCLPGLRIAGRISISDEKPGPWRLDRARHNRVEVANFNLRREARPLATSCGLLYPALVGLFQSQTRSQAPGDDYPRRAEPFSIAISISDEKPGPWRRRQQIAAQMGGENFNLRREARPLATTNLLTSFVSH